MTSKTLIGLVLLTACGSSSEPSPPEGAVASCRTTSTPASGDAIHSTRWLDAAGRVIRVDSELADGTQTFTMSYDAQGRLVREVTDEETLAWEYQDVRIVRTSDRLYTWVSDLDAGRIGHEGGPIENPDEMRWDISYGYDPQGRLFERVGADRTGPTVQMFVKMFTYGAMGRVATAKPANETPVTSFAYAQSGTTLTVELTGPMPRTWTYELDGQQRVVRSAVTPGASVSYAYDDAAHTITATSATGTVIAEGTCEAPAIVTAPALPMPIRYHANEVTLPNPAAADLSTFE